jgi:autotransporter-associated beta strand protein
MYKQFCRWVAVGVLVAGAAGRARAATNYWNDTGTDWTTTGNWLGAIPGSNDFAVFTNAAYANAPSLGSDTNLGALWLTGTSGALTIGGSSTLSLYGLSHITGLTNVALRVDGGAGALTLNPNLALLSNQIWINNAANAVTLAGALSGANSLTLMGGGAGGFAFTANNSGYSGATTINRTTLTLSGANGAIAAGTGLTLRNAGVLTLDNTTAKNNRLGGQALTSYGGTLNFNNPAVAGTSYAESIGTLTLNAGALTINTAQAASDGTSTLTIGSLTRNTGGTVLFSGTGLGADARNSITFTAFPALVNTVIPYALMFDGSRYDLVAQGAGNAVTNYTNYFTGDQATWAATTNARPSAMQVLSANRALQNLILDNGIVISNNAATDKTLYLTNGGFGMVVQTGGTSEIKTNTSGDVILNFGANEAIFNTIGNLKIYNNSTSLIAANAGVAMTKTGPGTLMLGSEISPSFQLGGLSGALNLNQGLLELFTGSSLGLSTLTNGIHFNGGNLTVHTASSRAYLVPFVVNADGTFTMDRYPGSTGTGNPSGFSNMVVNGSPTLTILTGPSVTSTTESMTNTLLTLNGPVTFVLSNGVSAATLLQFGAITDNGNTITLKGNGAFTQTAGWGGGTSGGLTLDAAYSGMATLNQSNSFTGGVVVNSGILLANNDNALGAGVLTLGGGTLSNSVSNTLNNNIYLGAASTAGVANAKTLTLTGAIGGAGGLNALDIIKTGPGTLVAGVDIALRGLQTNTVTAGTATFTGVLDDGGNNYGLTILGGGTTVLGGSNTYGGITTVNAGVLTLNNNLALGTTLGGTVISNGAALVLGNGVTVTGEALALIGQGVTYGALQAGAASTGTWAGPVVLNNNTVRIGSVDGAGVLTVSGPISDGLGSNLAISAFAGAGKIILSGSNTYSGGTSLTRGWLVLGVDNALPTNTVMDVRTSVILDPTILDLNGFNQTLGLLKNTAVTSNSPSMITNTVAGTKTLTLNQNADSSFGLWLGGSIALVKNGTGALTLTGTNTSPDGITINAGTLVANNDSALGPGLLTLAGGTLSNSVGNTLTNTINVSADSAIGVLAAKTLTLSGALTNSGALTKRGAGTLALYGANTYSNGTILNAGTLIITNDFNLGAVPGAAATNLTFSGASTLQAGADLTLANNRTILINGNITATFDTQAYTQTVNGLILGAGTTGSLTKVGTGVLSLLGNTSLTNLAVNGGTLVLSGNTNNLRGTLTVGNIPGTPAALLLTNGAQVLQSGTFAYIGNPNGANSNSAYVGGNGALWNLGTNSLYVGNGTSTGNWLVVDNGGTVLTSNGQLRIGVAANAVGNYLVITNGGQVSSVGSILGRGWFANSNSVYVGVNNARWNLGNNYLSIGGYTDMNGTNAWGNSLAVDQGGMVTNVGNLYVGAATNSTLNYLVITNGGQFFSRSAATLGYSAGGHSNWVYVGGTPGGGSNALWSLGAQTLTVGGSATATGNVLTVAAGGVLTNAGLVNLGGAGSQFNLEGDAYVSSVNLAASAQLNFTNGGALHASANGTLLSGAGTNYFLTGGGLLDSGVFAVSNNAAGGGVGGLTKAGYGTLVLNATNTFTGGTVLRQGALLLGAGGFSNLANTAGLTVQAAGALGTNGALDQAFLDGWLNARVAASGTVVTGAVAMAANTATALAFTNSALSNAFLGAAGAAATMGGAATWGDATVRLGGGNQVLTYTPAIGGATNVVIGPEGGNPMSTVFMPTNNSYTGGTRINSGTLYLTNDLNLGAVPGVFSGSNVILNGGTLSNNATAVTLNGKRGLALDVNGGTLAAGNNNSQFQVTTPISDLVPGTGGPLTIGASAGGGFVILYSNNTYSGGTILQPSGILMFAATASASNFLGTGAFTINGGGMRPIGTSLAVTITNAVTLAGDATILAGGGGTLTFSGPLTLANGNRILSLAALPLTTISGPIGDGGQGLGLIKTGVGSLLLTGTNTYTGGTFVGNGLLEAASTNAVPRFYEALTVSNGATFAVLASGAAGQWESTDIDLLRANGGFLAGAVLGYDTAASNVTYASNIGNSPAGALGLAKLGTGTLALTGSNTYTGGTLVLGTLQVGAPNALPSTGAVTLGDTNSAGSLDLNGYSQTITSLSVASISSAATNVLTIGAGQTLAVNGTGTNFLLGNSSVAATIATKFVATGGGALVITNGSYFEFGRNSNGNNGNNASMDLSRLGTFTLTSSGTVHFGNDSSGTHSSSTIITLATNNTITAAILAVNGGGGTAGTSKLLLGAGTNTINVNTFYVNNGNRGTGNQVYFSTNTGSLTLRAADGLGSANLYVGIFRVANTATHFMDLTGHDSDLQLNLLSVAENGNLGTATPNTQTAYFSFDTGMLTAATVRVGYVGLGVAAANSGAIIIGTNSIGGGTVHIGNGGLGLAQNLTTNSPNTGTVFAVANFYGGATTIGADLNGNSIAMAQGGGTNSATLNLTGGTVTLDGHIAKIGGAGVNTATVTLNGGTLDLTGHNLGDGTTPIDTLNFQAGKLMNVAELNGGMPLVKTTVGTLILAGLNTYTGGTTNGAGTLALGGDNVLGTGGLVLSGGTLASDGTTARMLGNNVTITANSQFGQAGIGTGDLQLSGVVDLGTTTRTLTVSNATTFAGTLTNTAGLTKGGPGTLALAVDNTYGGVTSVRGGVLLLNSANAVPGGIGTMGGSNVLVLGGGVIGLGTNNSLFTRYALGNVNLSGTNVYWLSGNISGFAAFGSDATVNLGGNITPTTLSWNNSGGTLGLGLLLGASTADKTVNFLNPITWNTQSRTVQAERGSAPIDGILSGALTDFSGNWALVKTGNGVLALNATNNYGDTMLLAGTLMIGTNGTLGTLGRGTVTDNGVLQFNRSNAYTVTNFITGSGSVVQSGDGLLTLTSNNNYAGTTLISGGILQVGNGGTSGTLGLGAVTNNADLWFNRSNDYTVGNNIAGSGALTKLGANTQTLTGASTYTGGTLISNGMLRIGVANALPTNTTLYADTLGIFDLNGNDQQVGGLPGYRGMVTNSGAAATLTLNFGNGTTNAFLGTLGGLGGLTVTGGGLLNLTGTNSFSGGTAVSNGSTYAVNGLHNGGVITAYTDGRVQGTGFISALNVNGGTYAPGNSLATQTVASLTLTNAGLLEIELSNAGHDMVIVTNTLSIAAGGQLRLNLATYSFVSATPIVIVDWNAAGYWDGTQGYATNQWFTLNDVSGPMHGWVLTNGVTFAVNGGSGATNLFTINYDDLANGGNVITLSAAIPEPGTASLLALAGLAFLARRLRRRRAQG